MKKAMLVALVGFSTLILAGCTAPVTFNSITREHFKVEVPSHFKEFTTSEGSGELAYFSDDNETTFIEGAVSIYMFEDVYSEEIPFDQQYCEDTYEWISNPDSLGDNYSGINKKTVSLVAASDTKSAYCDISYELQNKDTEEFVATQNHRQFLFIDGTNEIIIEAATTKSELPEYLQKALNSFEVIPAGN